MDQPSRAVWTARIVWITALGGALLLLPGRAGAQNGALRVTSFPSGANVSVDGNDTGKVTPMSISVSVGTHTVVVSIPNSSWTPDSRDFPVVEGNNDLSVTLLPNLVGLMGPPGPPGAAATIQVGTTMTVPTGTPASVVNGGTANAAILNFLIPQGPQGPAGPAATIQVGTTMTVAAGTPASVLNGGTANAAILNFLIPQGPQGLKGDMGAAGADGAAGPPGPGLGGRKEFQSNGTFTVPTGVSRLSVELYGAGGGGTVRQCNAGGGGGGGAYTSTIIFPVQEGQTLTIDVGIGGSAGASSAVVGGNGGDTQVLDANSTVLAVAHGGGGGQPDPLPCVPPAAGAAGGALDPSAMISHTGAAAPSSSPLNSGGMGYQVTGFAFQSNGQFGGGGAGRIILSPAQAGQGGYALLSW